MVQFDTRRVAASMWVAATLCWLSPSQALATDLEDAAKVDFSWGVKITLRDGVKLNATVYRPKGQSAPAPCIFTLTPYISQTYHDRGVYFAAHGLPFLTVDVRGRGNSEGEFRPFIQEAKDGHDVVEWLAKQPYCNGKVSMWGGSYAGYDQWATAKELPPHLSTIVPVASAHAGVDFPMRNNIFYPYNLQWLTLVSGRAAQDGLFGDGGFWTAKMREWFVSGAPFNTYDRIVGNPSPIFQEWLQHPHPDAYWDTYNPTPAQYAKLDMPILSITGSYDGDQPGALAFYRQHLQHASAKGRAGHYLIIGPWDHAGTRTPKAKFGGLEFGPASLLDLPKLHLAWYAWTMQGGPKPDFLRKPVAYYVMGTDTWRYADSLDAITAEARPYYLDSTGNPSDAFASGSLKTGSAGSGGPDHYVYDPRDTRISDIESEEGPEELVSQRLVLASAGPQLVYHSAPLDQDTEISGFFKFSAWLAIDQPDTDFTVSVYDVDRDGNSILLSNDIMRARYREDLRTPRLVQTTEPQRYDFERFMFVSRQLGKGHRLRLTVGPVSSIGMQKNYNSGGVVAEESMRDARPVTVRLFHDAAHPTALYVPIAHPVRKGEPEAPDAAFLGHGGKSAR
ncbi:CocE/NonD family hydrolase [Luteimonas sp. RIT-PG2_3]